MNNQKSSEPSPKKPKLRDSPTKTSPKAHVSSPSKGTPPKSTPPKASAAKSGGSGAGAGSKAVAPIGSYCDFCLGDTHLNARTKKPEKLVRCHQCQHAGHPSCMKFTDNMKLCSTKPEWKWQCSRCKACAVCAKSENDNEMLLCDDCDMGFHMYCLKPPVQKAPEGSWSCEKCLKDFGAKAAGYHATTGATAKAVPSAGAEPQTSSPGKKAAAATAAVEKVSPTTKAAAAASKEKTPTPEPPDIDEPSPKQQQATPASATDGAGDEKKKELSASTGADGGAGVAVAGKVEEVVEPPVLPGGENGEGDAEEGSMVIECPGPEVPAGPQEGSA